MGNNNNDTLADQDFDIICLALSLSDDSTQVLVTLPPTTLSALTIQTGHD